MSLTIRSYEPRDADAVDAVTTAAYGRPMSPAMRTRVALDPGSVIVATSKEGVVGTVSATRYGAHAYVASMAVHPSRQREGIARKLMIGLLEHMASLGVATFDLDATDAGAPLYQAFGFVDTDRTTIFERSGAPRTAPEPPEVVTDSPAFRAALKLDREATGCDRESILAMLAREADAHLAVAPDAFAFSHDDVVGPWIAFSESGARDVFDRTLETRPHVARVFVPESNATAQTIVTARGFAGTRILRHMTRGMSPMRRDRVYGQASLGHG